jgi:hypothetical protein
MENVEEIASNGDTNFVEDGKKVNGAPKPVSCVISSCFCCMCANI